VRCGRSPERRALAATHLFTHPLLMRKAKCDAMSPEETGWSTPEVQDIPEEDLAASAHGLTGRDA
jgi:hypothetical protein